MFKLFKRNREERSDLDLVNDYQSTGNMTDLGVLYERYIDLVYGLCLKYFKNEADAEDAVIAIFETLTEKLRKHEVNNFKSWLYVLAKNHCLMALRKSSKRIVENSAPEVMHSLDQRHLNEETGLLLEIEGQEADLRDCIKKLPNQQQRCITAFYFEECSYKEIAASENLPLNKVRSFIQNGRRNLKSCMEKKQTLSKKI